MRIIVFESEREEEGLGKTTPHGWLGKADHCEGVFMVSHKAVEGNFDSIIIVFLELSIDFDNFF